MLSRIDVDSVAKPNARLQVVQRVDVRVRPPQRRLQDDANVVVTVAAHLALQPQRVLGSGGVLHVDADEVPARRGILDDDTQVVAAPAVAELQSDSGQLY